MSVAKRDQRPERIHRLVRGWQAGDERAKTELVRVLRPYVVAFARRVGKGYQPTALADIEQAAWVGVATAANSYDADRGTKFLTWMLWQMRKEASQWQAAYSGALRLPYPAWQAARRIDRYLDERGLEADQVNDDDLNEASGTLQAREILAARLGAEIDPKWDEVATTDTGYEDVDGKLMRIWAAKTAKELRRHYSIETYDNARKKSLAKLDEDERAKARIMQEEILELVRGADGYGVDLLEAIRKEFE